jgi:microcin C transport system permease protein
MSSVFWRRYRQNPLAWASTILFAALLVVASAASLIANDRPVAMHLHGRTYFPIFVDYKAEDLGQQGFVPDYLTLAPEIAASGGWAVWPPLVQRPYEPNLNFESLPAPPRSTTEIAGKTVTHVLGTDTAGRDLLTRLLYGCRTSLLMALAITLLSLVLGVALGAIMGYKGGTMDLLVGRFLETLGYFPVIFMIIILVAFLETPSLAVISVIFALLGISPFAFYMRGQVLSLRKQTFVEAATALGQTDGKIMFKHILPNALSPILVLVPFTVTTEISFLATIDFLGFGVQPPTASLGAILRSGFDNIENRSWLVLYSSVVLVAILLLVNFIGDGVRDGMDPHATVNKREFKKLVADAKA